MLLGENQSVLVYDIETDGLDTETSKVKWFGAYSLLAQQYYLLPYTEKKEILNLIDKHKVLVGFNNKEFDNPILENDMGVDFDYKVIVDLYQVSKTRLPNMGIQTQSYKLDTIIKVLGLDDDAKGSIDYKVFQKDTWTTEETGLIKKYLKQDIVLTKKLLKWYFDQFKPLRKYLSEKDQNNYADIKASTASLAYRVICNLAGLPIEFSNDEVERPKIYGGHHIEPRKDRASGDIVSVDFVSAYPHAIMQGNLFSECDEGWSGDYYYKVSATYNNKEMGKVEKALQRIFLERLKAKKEGDKTKSTAYKIVINSLYGTTGNPVFKSLYNPNTASNCTSIVRTWMRRFASVLEEDGFNVLYGFTDSVMVEIPEGRTSRGLLYTIYKFMQEVKSHLPFPLDTFKLEIDKEMNFIWFVAKNCYLWVDKEGKVGYRSTLLNKNTPDIIMQLFNDYISPKIVKELDVNFTEEEIITELKKILVDNLDKAGEVVSVKDVKDYKSRTSIQYQVSQHYGEGRHILIPNTAGIGVGKAKGRKNIVGVRYCTIEDFKTNNLCIDDIDYQKLIKHIKPFYSETQIQQQLN